MFGSRTPPRRPCSLINLASAIASSMSFRKIWPMPARRSGASLQKSTSQRLWARIPASRCSYSSGGGGWANSTKLGKNGGTVFGKITSPTIPSASCSRVAALAVPVALAAIVLEVLERVLVLAPPGVELVAVRRVEVLAVLRVAPTGVRVGGDDRVVAVGHHCAHDLTLPGAPVRNAVTTIEHTSTSRRRREARALAADRCPDRVSGSCGEHGHEPAGRARAVNVSPVER